MKNNLQENSRLWDYQIMEELGRGEYGQVYRVKYKKNNQDYALKKVNISSAHQKQKIQAFRQIKALKLIRHPDIIQYYQSFLSLDNIYIVMEYAAKGDFSNIISQRRKKQKYYTQDQLWEIFGTLASAIKHLHQKYIIHRDIKVENIFITKNGKVKIGDLGMAKILPNSVDMLSTRVGTPVYFAPQIIQHQLYSFPVDIWALGCVFYYLATLQHPFKQATIETLGYYIIQKDPRPIKGQYSPQMINFIMSLLDKNPNTRLTIYQIIQKIKTKNQLKINNKIAIFNIKQLLLIKQSSFEENEKSPTRKRRQNRRLLEQDLQHRYQQQLKNNDKNREDNQQKKQQGKKRDQYRNFSMVLVKRDKMLAKDKEQQPLSPMIKTNGFADMQKKSPIKVVRKSTQFKIKSIDRASFRQQEESDRWAYLTQRSPIRGAVL